MVIPYQSIDGGNVGFTENDLMWIYLVGGLLTLVTSQLIGGPLIAMGKHIYLVFFFFFTWSHVDHHGDGLRLSFALIFTSLFFFHGGG